MANIALLGAQNPHSVGHLQTLNVLPEIEAVFLWDEDDKPLQKLKKTGGDKVKNTYTDLDAVLSRDDIQVVVASLRTDRCVDVCLRAIEAGKHILAEKPLGLNAQESERIVLAAERAGLKIGVFYLNRCHPVVKKARDTVQDGAIGSLMSVEMRWITTQVKSRDPKHWLFHSEYSAGGILAWLGCHYIDLMRFVAADEIVSVAAETAIRSGEDIDVEDIAVVSVRFKSGAVGLLHGGYVLALSGGGFYNRLGNDTYVGFSGRSGRMYWSPTDDPPCLHLESAVETHRDAPMWKFSSPQMPESPAYGGKYGEHFVRDFLVAAEGREMAKTVATGRDALQAARIVDAAYESSRTGKRIEVPPPE